MYDAIIVPGGGVRENGALPVWVQSRFDHAFKHWQGEFFICLSAGTVFKAPPQDKRGFPLLEAVAGAQYLRKLGVPAEKILTETASYDTIGNAYFARVIHTDPVGWRRLLIVTSAFHMARTRTIFEWVFGFDTTQNPYQLDFSEATDENISPEVLAKRREKEAAGIERLLHLTTQIRTLPQLHHFLFTRHDAYAIARLAQSRPTVSPEIKDLY